MLRAPTQLTQCKAPSKSPTCIWLPFLRESSHRRVRAAVGRDLAVIRIKSAAVRAAQPPAAARLLPEEPLLQPRRAAAHLGRPIHPPAAATMQCHILLSMTNEYMSALPLRNPRTHNNLDHPTKPCMRPVPRKLTV